MPLKRREWPNGLDNVSASTLEIMATVHSSRRPQTMAKGGMKVVRLRGLRESRPWYEEVKRRNSDYGCY